MSDHQSLLNHRSSVLDPPHTQQLSSKQELLLLMLLQLKRVQLLLVFQLLVLVV